MTAGIGIIGAALIADLIEARKNFSTVPAWPWGLLAPVLRLLPTAVIASQFR